MKVVISNTKTGKSYNVEVPEDKQVFLLDKKIGETLDGGPLGIEGYSLEITGGSDRSGFPMRKDIYGTRKIKAFLGSGVGFNLGNKGTRMVKKGEKKVKIAKRKGERRKKMIMGNTVSSEIVQINTKIVKEGPKPLQELFGKKTEEKKE